MPAHDLRCEWGEEGLRSLRGDSDALIIVDVLSFSTAVDVALSRGAIILPHRWKDENAGERARQLGAALAGPRREGGLSLSPASMLRVGAGQRVLLPSPNGSTLSLLTGEIPTYAGCLRNAPAVARAAAAGGRRISVIPAGEHWHGGGLRVALEDWLGAGAILDHLPGAASPEARAAVAAFRSMREALRSVLEESVSGRELIERAYPMDVELAADWKVSDCVPLLRGGAYVNAA
jgi:2-phosphosulfolactate phosphatase